MLALLLGAACGPTNENTRETTVVVADSNSGDDVSITGARGLFDAVVNDNVSATTGDNTDYKYVDVDSRGTLDIRIRFQQLTFGGLVSLHNDFGDILWEESAPLGTEEVLIEGFETLPGRYYVRVYANEGAADYAIGQTFTPEVVEEPWEPEEVPEEVVEDTTEEDEARARRRRERRERRRAEREAREAAEAANGDSDSDGSSSDGSSNSDGSSSDGSSDSDGSNSDGSNSDGSDGSSSDGSNSDGSNSDGSDGSNSDGSDGSNSDGSNSGDSGTAERSSVRASIVNLRVSGSGTLLILRGCGSNSGLAEGESGRISNGSRATLSRITGSDSCEASSSASIGEMSGATHVTF